MPLRALLRYLANNEHLVQRLADSYPVRRAAQLAVSMFYRGKEKLSEVDPQQVNRFMSFLKKFSENMKEGIADAKKQLKKWDITIFSHCLAIYKFPYLLFMG